MAENKKDEKNPLPEQLEAIKAEKNTVVAAGAGSGKTTVLSLRFLNLVKEHNLNVDEILTLTFTKKATVEMSDRIYKVLKNDAPDQAAKFYKANIKTLDSYCNSVAKLGCRFYGISPDFVQDDEAVSKAVSDKALPFLLKNRDNPVIKYFVDVHDYSSVANSLFVEPILECSKIAQPVDFKKDLANQYERISQMWNETTDKIGEKLQWMWNLENDFDGNASAKFWLKYLEIKKNYSIPENLKITAEMVADGSAIKLVNKYTEEIQVFSFQKPGNSKFSLADDYREAIDEIKNLSASLYPYCDYIEGVSFVKEVIPLMEEFQDMVMDVKRTTKCLTFKDVSNMALCILRDYPEIRALEKKKYKAIMIDEFQDNNSDQRDMLFLLAEKEDRMEKSIPDVSELCEDKLFFVGDEKQSIYRFRGADVAVFNALSKDFKEGNIWMATNHRSHPELISAFNTIFGGSVYGSKSAKNVNFETTPPAVFYTEKQQKGITEIPEYEAVYHDVLVPYYREEKINGPRIHVARYSDNSDASADALVREEAEAEWVARKIKTMIEEDGINPSDIAILVKSYTHQGKFERSLLRNGVPYDTEVVKGFFSDGVVCDIVSYLRLCAYPKDTIAYAQVLHSPFVNLTLVETEAVLAQGKMPFSEEAEHVLEEDALERFRLAGDFYKSVIETVREESIARAVSKLWYECGYRYETLWNHTVEMYGKLYDILFELARKSDEKNDNLAGFVDSVSYYSSDLNKLELSIPVEKAEGVHIMSIHKSKGLEFKVVFVCNTNTGKTSDSGKMPVFIHKKYGLTFRTPASSINPGESVNPFFEEAKAEKNNQDAAELRRVTYVALTRAIDELYITSGNFKAPGTSRAKKYSELLPGGLKNPVSIYDCLGAVIEYYEQDEVKEASPFCEVEQIPFYERGEVYASTRRGNTVESRETFIKQLRRENPYESAKVFEKEIVTDKYVSPSKLHAEDDETSEKKQFEVCSHYGEIDRIVNDHKGFNYTNFGTIAHAYMEAVINNTENECPYSSKDIIGLDGSKKDLEIIESVCEKMKTAFKASELGKAAMEAGWHKAEYTFRSRVAGKIISGSIDLVFENQDGTFTIVDYKTNQTIEPEIYYNQLACYRQAVSQMMNVSCDKIKCCLYYLRFNEIRDITEQCGKVDLEKEVNSIFE